MTPYLTSNEKAKVRDDIHRELERISDSVIVSSGKSANDAAEAVDNSALSSLLGDSYVQTDLGTVEEAIQNEISCYLKAGSCAMDSCPLLW